MVATNIEKRVQDGFAKQGLMSTLGARLGEIQPGICSIVVPYSDHITQQHGFFHGGVTATLADNAAGFAGYTLMREDEQPLSVEFKINFITPARGDALEARAKVIRSGHRLKHVKVEVFAFEADTETLVAIALATIASTKAIQEVA